MNEKENLDKKWRESPAKTLTLGSYLPNAPGATPNKSIHDGEVERQTAALEMVVESGELLGRASNERRLYLQTSGERYGQVSFLSQASELSKLFDALSNAGSSLEVQEPYIIQAVTEDISNLSEKSEQLFGGINEERWHQVAYRAKQHALRIIASPDESDELKQSARNVLQHFPDFDQPLLEKEYAPTQALIEHWQPVLQKFYEPLITLTEPERETPLSSTELKELFERGIQTLCDTYGLEEARNWPVRIGNTNISVDHEESCVWIPPDKSYKPDRALALLVHEIGGHLMRVLKGRLTGDAFLGSDMPGRSIDEEGLLVLFEQILEGSPKESGMTYFVAVALANTSTNESPVPLSELADITLDYLAVKRGRVLSESERATEANRVHRVTRGMPSVTINNHIYQATYNMDLKYSTGQGNAVEYLSSHMENSEEALNELLSGRFAYSNPDQLAYARAHRTTSS